jgi:glycosyltransferase involved in cell wall biosynthesis
MEEKRVAVVLLTWKRINALMPTLRRLHRQTYKNFDIVISNSNPSSNAIDQVDQAAKFYNARGLRIDVRHDSNEHFAFRRFFIGKHLYELGYDIIMFIDDDIRFPDNYIKNCLSQYEPKTYKSGFTWIFYNRGRNYYKFRKRVYTNDVDIHYAGTAVSMIDASIFADKKLILNAPKEFYPVEDLWLSYFVQQKSGWSVKYMETPNVIIGGADKVALWRQVQSSGTDKAALLHKLLNMGWKIPAELPAKLV